MNDRKHYNIELSQKDAEILQEFLDDSNYKYEISGCFEMVHFEIFLNKDELGTVEKYLNDKIFKEAITEK